MVYIASEHFKLSTDEIIPTIIKIVNTIVMDKDRYGKYENWNSSTCLEKEQRWQPTRKL